MSAVRDLLRCPRCAVLVALALLAQALVPAGWMPARANGTVSLVLCGGVAELNIDHPAAQLQRFLDGKHDRGEDHGDGSDKPPCHFASGAAAVQSAEPAFEPAPMAADAAEELPYIVGVGRGLAAPPPPSTGPPSLI